jgi:hypothetical protein
MTPVRRATRGRARITLMIRIGRHSTVTLQQAVRVR